MTRKHILQVIASSRGGGAAHVAELARRLDPARYAVTVAMPEDGGAVGADDFTAAGLDFISLPIAAGASAQALIALRRALHTCDLVHLHGARAALFGRTTALSLGCSRPRIVYTIHGYAAPYYPPLRRRLQIGLERTLAPLVDCALAVSQAERSALLESGVFAPERVAVVWNGIDAAAFAAPHGDRAAWRASLGIPVDALVVTTVCRLYKPRDFPTLIAAFAQARHACPAAHLLIVGDGPDRPAVEALVAQFALTDAVTLTGWRTDLPAVYAASDIYTLTTWGWEGLPLTVLEAMAAGLPVVGTRAGGFGEAVVENVTGILAQRQSVASLEDALLRLLQDGARRARLGAAGRGRVRDQFDVERMVAKIAAHYDRLLDEG